MGFKLKDMANNKEVSARIKINKFLEESGWKERITEIWVKTNLYVCPKK